MDIIDFRIGRARVLARQMGDQAANAQHLTGADRAKFIRGVVEMLAEGERQAQEDRHGDDILVRAPRS